MTEDGRPVYDEICAVYTAILIGLVICFILTSNAEFTCDEQMSPGWYEDCVESVEGADTHFSSIFILLIIPIFMALFFRIMWRSEE